LLLFINACSKPTPEYTIESKVNPYKIAPLTALLEIKSVEPCIATVKVLGDTPIEQSFDLISDSLSIPVIGLYPGTINNVVVRLKY
jgi:arylsulfate sulfotransferase